MSSLFGLGQIAPEIQQEEQQRVHDQVVRAYHEWRKGWDAKQPTFTLENIRFEHDPGWDRRFFSMQCMHDGSHWFWKVTRMATIAYYGAWLNPAVMTALEIAIPLTVVWEASNWYRKRHGTHDQR